jgi:predicted lactoylglutathione lyase
MNLPNLVPELPVSNLQASGTFYEQKMGFRVDWVYEDYLAGISKDAARLFLRRRTEQEEKQDYNVLVWLNLDSPLEVDQLHEEWKRSGVDITDEPETNPLESAGVHGPGSGWQQVPCVSRPWSARVEWAQSRLTRQSS